MEKFTDNLFNYECVNLSNFSSRLFDMINNMNKPPRLKRELCYFVYEFVVKGKLIDISKENDDAIDVLYPICRSLRMLN